MGPLIICETVEGLCNRINGIVSAIATRRPIRRRWAVNQQCPMQFEDLFSETFGMDVVNESAQEYAYARTQERLCWAYRQNIDGLLLELFEHRVFEAYRRMLIILRYDGS